MKLLHFQWDVVKTTGYRLPYGILPLAITVFFNSEMETFYHAIRLRFTILRRNRESLILRNNIYIGPANITKLYLKYIIFFSIIVSKRLSEGMRAILPL